MIKSIQVVPNTTTSKILFFDELNFEAMPDPRVIPLFGANGSGKSTLIKAI